MDKATALLELDKLIDSLRGVKVKGRAAVERNLIKKKQFICHYCLEEKNLRLLLDEANQLTNTIMLAESE